MSQSNIKILRLDTENTDFAPQVQQLYFDAGWDTRPASDSAYVASVARIGRALKKSYCCFGAFDGSSMVGFFRAFSDGESDAYLLDLIVTPSYRKLGIATRLCESLVGFLKSKNIEWITVIGTPEAFPLYSKIGAQMKNHTPFRL